MNQRQKARDFLRREGHGDAVRDVNVGGGDKAEVPHEHHIGRPAPARSKQVYNSGEMHPDDGLLRQHVREV